MRKILVTIICVILCISVLNAQTGFFNEAVQNEINYKKQGHIYQQQYRLLTVNNTLLHDFLWSLPGDNAAADHKNSPVISLPMPDGKMASFRVWQYDMMEPGLAHQFQGIKTFAGYGIDDPYATLRMDYNPSYGFSAQILSVNGDVYIDPYEKGDINHCISFYSKDYIRSLPFHCTVSKDPASAYKQETAARGNCRGNVLFTYRLAIACTGEYAAAVCLPASPTTPATMAAIVTTINRVNGIYERDIAMRFLLVANNNLLVFLNPATDPYTNGNEAAMMDENQVTTNNIIGAANYDIGQVFGTGNNSAALIYAVCNSPNKAKAVSSLPNPTGDLFDVGRVAHNLAHPFSGFDTHNSDDVSCTGGPAVSGYEPGSGTTIMSAAGSCGPDNLQPLPDPNFHGAVLNNITELFNGPIANCMGTINTGNNWPQITAMPGNGSYIPINTPFTLTATATDPDGDPVTYCWDEEDRSQPGPWNSGAARLISPLFKSRVPTASGTRTFPDIAVILAGYPANPPAVQGGLKGEVLPAISRTIQFGLTIRDNRGGVVNDDNVCANQLFPFEIYSVGTAGPFKVNMPEGGETWSSGSLQTILWDVAGTDLSPINTSLVNILLSTDGGLTYPVFLAGGVSNTGFAAVALPNINTTNARIKIEAVGNIYFDISNNNFSIIPAPVGFEFNAPAPQTVACPGPAEVSYNLGAVSNGGYNTPVSLNATGIPTGATLSFSVNPVTPGNATTVTLSNVNSVPNGTYYITVTGTSGSLTRTRILVLKIQPGAAPIITSQPTSQTDCEGGNVSFSVTAPSAIAYQWQISTDGGFVFNNISPGGNAAVLTLNNITLPQNNNKYRCIVRGQCNTTTSNVVSVTVIGAPFISTQPQSQVVCAGKNAVFTITVSGPAPTYQWQVNINNGAGFTNIAGAISNSLSFSAITSVMNNYQYRCLVLKPGCFTPLVSNVAVLTVNDLPVVSITAAPYLGLFPGLQTTLTAAGTVSPGASPFTYRWYRGGAFLGGVTGNTYRVDITKTGSYRAEILDARGCVGQSNTITITDSASTRFFIFPNPARNLVEFAFYNPNGQPVSWRLEIFNAAGIKMLDDVVSNAGPYPKMVENVSQWAKAVYFVILKDKSGKIIGKGKLLVH
ncbi:MAG: zinc-dependent metalloprotease family protein [Chitinophagaceae bacterium]